MFSQTNMISSEKALLLHPPPLACTGNEAYTRLPSCPCHGTRLMGKWSCLPDIDVKIEKAETQLPQAFMEKMWTRARP